MPATCEPAKPSQDFFGLIVGAIGCRPASTPGRVAADVGRHHADQEREHAAEPVVGRPTISAANEQNSGT